MDYNPNFVGGYGPSDANLMVVMEAPGEKEDEQGRPAVGPAGNLAREMLTLAGINPSKCFFTNVEKYRPPQNKLSRYKDVGRKPFQDIHILRNEIEAIGPKCILVLGEHALKAVTGKKGIKKWRGSIIPAKDFPEIKCVSSYHTSALLRAASEETKVLDYSARAYMQGDFNRAVQQSRFREFRLPVRHYEYATNADEFEGFLDIYRDQRRVSVDIETTKGTCIPTCIGFAFNDKHGMSVPLLNVDARFPINHSELVKLVKIVQRILGDESYEIIGQNFKGFDWRKLVKPFAFKIKARLVHDCGIAQNVLYPEFPKSLQFQTSTWTEEPYYKDELKEYDPDKEDFRSILLYNAKDVCVPFEIAEKQIAELHERHLYDFFLQMMELPDLYMKMFDRGIRFNRQAQKDQYDVMNVRDRELQTNINLLVGREVNIAQHAKIKKLIYEELEIPARQNCKDETLVEVLALHCRDDARKYSIISDILELRKVRRSKNGPLSAKPDYDGRMRSNFNLNGTAIGRTSTSIVKPPERPTKLGLQFQNQSKHGEGADEERAMLEADPGHELVSIDMSQADARVVAALAKDTWLMKCFDDKKDVHSITASWYFGKENPDDDMSPIGVDPIGERFIGKSTRHALHYKCKWKKLQSTINKLARKFNLNVSVTAKECKMFIYIFEKKSPSLQNFWGGVLEAIKRDKKQLTAASGRSRQFFGIFDPNLYFSYIPAASVTDHNKFAMARIAKRIPHIQFLKEDHDSALFQCRPSERKEYMEIAKEEYERPMDLSRCSLPREPIIIPCEFEVGDNYRDMRKWKEAQ